MRNFVVSFLVIILAFTLSLLVIAPSLTEKKPSDKQADTHLENLLYSKPKKKKAGMPGSNASEKCKPDEKCLQEVIPDFEKYKEVLEMLDSKETKVSKKEKKTETEIENKSKTNQSEPQENKQTSFEDLSNELTQKYGNDPNAEISQEDLMKIMNQAMEMLNQNMGEN